MAGYPSANEILQWAKEATKGDDAAATSRIGVESFNVQPQSTAARPPLKKGYLIRNPGNETATRRWVNWTAEGPFNYEQGQHWFNMGIKSVAAPSGSSPYVWDHVRSIVADPALYSYRIERRQNDYSTQIDEEFPYCMATKIVLSGSDDELVRLRVEGFGRAPEDEAITAAQTLPTLELPPTARTKIYKDTNWAGLGGTPIASQVLGWEWEFNTGVKPVWTKDNRTDLSFVVDVLDVPSVNITLTLLLGANYTTERAAAQALTAGAIRIEAAGSSSRQLQLDALVKHEKPELEELGEFEGQKMVVCRYQDTTDGTNFARAKLTNLVATLA